MNPGLLFRVQSKATTMTTLGPFNLLEKEIKD